MSKKLKQLQGGLADLFGEKETTAGESEEIIETIKDEELRKALQDRQAKDRGRTKPGRKPSRPANEGRVCTIVDLDKWEKLKTISLRETLQIKEVVNKALDMLIEAYENENGAIRPAKQGKSKLFDK